MKKLTVAFLSIALVAVGTIFVIGQTAGSNSFEGKENFGNHGKRGFGKRGKRGGKKMMRLFRQLDLTEDQKAQLKEIRMNSRETTKPLRQQMRELRKQASELGTDGVYDSAQIEAIAAQQADLSKQMFIEKQKVKAQMFAILTPEQKTKVAELKEQFKQKMEARKQLRQQRKAEKANQ